MKKKTKHKPSLGHFKKVFTKKGKYVKFCPMCKSTNIGFDAKLETVYDVCKKCGYRSSHANFPEKKIE